MRARAWLATALGTLAWLVPFVTIVGPRSLVTLMQTHATGHFTVWGGTVVRERGVLRVVDFARDVFVDGLGGGVDGLGVAILVGSASIAIMGLQAWRDEGWVHARTIAIALAPYALWILFGQNVHDQPRHALPLVVALAAGLGCAATSSTRARTGGGVLLTLIALRTFGDASARVETPPPAAQLVLKVQALPDAQTTAVFGGPSARFFQLVKDPRAHAETVPATGDAELAMGRLDSLPKRVLVTSELADLDAVRAQLTPFGLFCRPERIERRAPCLRVFEWHRR
jgi:hypothetical protein